MLRALNYGSIGVVIGHEISHGFDHYGKKRRRNNLLQLWIKNTHLIFSCYTVLFCIIPSQVTKVIKMDVRYLGGLMKRLLNFSNEPNVLWNNMGTTLSQN